MCPSFFKSYVSDDDSIMRIIIESQKVASKNFPSIFGRNDDEENTEQSSQEDDIEENINSEKIIISKMTLS